MSDENKPAESPAKPLTMLQWLKGILENLVAGDRTKGTAYVIDHPAEYGFEWKYGAIGEGQGSAYRVLRSDAPYIHISASNVPLFLATWGPQILADGLMGQSVKVKTDRVNRTMLQKDRNVTQNMLMSKQVHGILYGVITRTTTVVVRTKFMVNGVAYDSAEAAELATNNDEKIKALEMATAFLAVASDNGLDSKKAREMAEQLFPLAFVHVEKVETTEEVPAEEDEEENDDEQEEASDES